MAPSISVSQAPLPAPAPANPLGPLVDGPTPPFPTITLLTGTAVCLERLTPAHADGLYPLLGGAENARLWDYMLSPPPLTLSAFQDFIANRCRLTDPYDFAIVDTATSEPLGLASYLNIRPADRVLEVGHVLFSTRLQRTRGATEAMYLMMRWAFEVGYVRYEWKCHALNEGSARAARRLGFVYEGCFRRHMVVKGRSRDTSWFSVVEGEWPVVKGGLERWLEEGNFDEGGRQKVGLVEVREGVERM